MTTDSYPGTPIFIKALTLVASGSANTQNGAQNAISFLNSALNQGLSLPDQAIAYKTLGDKYITIEDYNKSYISNKKALNIKKSLIISEEEEKVIWNHTYELIAATATHFAENDGIDGINLYKEVIELTDHPRAHLNIGVLYAKNNDIENAAYHWQYILDNEYKLGANGYPLHAPSER